MVTVGVGVRVAIGVGVRVEVGVGVIVAVGVRVGVGVGVEVGTIISHDPRVQTVQEEHWVVQSVAPEQRRLLQVTHQGSICP